MRYGSVDFKIVSCIVVSGSCSCQLEIMSLVDFKKCLHSLKISKSQISSMTKRAEAMVIHAHAVVDAIIEYIDQVIYLESYVFLCILCTTYSYYLISVPTCRKTLHYV